MAGQTIPSKPRVQMTVIQNREWIDPAGYFTNESMDDGFVQKTTISSSIRPTGINKTQLQLLVNNTLNPPLHIVQLRRSRAKPISPLQRR
jgi:hypothetical protein